MVQIHVHECSMYMYMYIILKVKFLCIYCAEELKGLYITSINTQGAVGRDGRAKVNDRILRVDGKSLRGLENMEAATVLRNSGNPVRLVFGRPRAVVGQTERGGDDVPRRGTGVVSGSQGALPPP